MRILSELVFIPQTQESIGCCITFPDFFIFFIEQLFLIFSQMLSIWAFGRRVVCLFIFVFAFLVHCCVFTDWSLSIMLVLKGHLLSHWPKYIWILHNYGPYCHFLNLPKWFCSVKQKHNCFYHWSYLLQYFKPLILPSPKIAQMIPFGLITLPQGLKL